jgi:phage baseplate assembly protein gpV
MSDLVTILRAIVREEIKALRLGDIGVVSASFPHEDGDAHNYECDVKLREGELLLTKVPIATPHIGMASAPAVGDLVLISYVGGDPNHPIVVGRLYSDEKNPPPHAADEWRVVSPHSGKTSIAIDKDHSVVVTAGETVLTVKESGNVELKGKKDLVLQVEGNVQLKCKDAKIDASGNIDLGSGGAGVITEQTHKCYLLTGQPWLDGAARLGDDRHP